MGIATGMEPLAWIAAFHFKNNGDDFLDIMRIGPFISAEDLTAWSERLLEIVFVMQPLLSYDSFVTLHHEEIGPYSPYQVMINPDDPEAFASEHLGELFAGHC